MSRRAWLLFGGLAVLWGLPYFLIKVALVDLQPMFIVAARLALAAAVLVPVALLTGKEARSLAGRWRWILVFAVIEFVLPFGLLTWAETRVTSSLAGLTIAAVPTISALIAAQLGLADKLDVTRVIGLVLGALGVGVLLGLDVGSDSVLAVLALLGVAVGYAVGPILLRLRLEDAPGPAVMAAATTIAALIYLPWLASAWPAGQVRATTWWALAALGLLCSAAAFLIMFALVAEAGPTRMTVVTYLNPVVAVALGVFVLDEALTVGMLVGFPLIILGSLLATRSNRHPAKTLRVGLETDSISP
ncbi:MAG: DMT family transporter [Candidatus Nanopelagicales bacterium]